MSEVVTIFRNTFESDKPHYITIDQVIDRIKNGKSKLLLDQIRTITDKKQRDEVKKKLPCICFSGQFSHRANDKIIKHSGLVAIDFDHLNGRLQEFKQRICQDVHTYLAFVSPSGDGLKVIVRIPDSVKTHKKSCDALSDYYKEETLDEFKDVARICYESYDPEIYFNPSAEVFKLLKEIQTIKRTIETRDIISDFDEIIEKLITWLSNKSEHYKDGNKHKYLVKFAAACNRFGIPEVIACQKAIYKFISTAGQVETSDFQKIFNDVYSHYGHLNCTAHFDKKGTAVETITNTVLTEAIFDISVPLKDVIYLDSVRDSMLQTFHTGRARGESTGFKTIDDYFRIKRKHLTLVHGIMNQGKSTFLLQVCLLLSIKKNYKWACFSPEQDPPDDFYDDLIQAYIGKNTQPYFLDQMSESDYIDGMNFVKEHFFYIFPENDAPNQEYINQRFAEVIVKHKVDGCIIDPYNQLDNDIIKFGGREDQYLSKFLTIQKRFAQTYDIFMFIVTHPKGSITKNNQGDYNCPDMYDLAGGAMWGNKCDEIVCIYRPFANSNKADTTVKFISQKIKKRKLSGNPGEVLLDYDLKSGRYLENINGLQSTPFNPGFEQRPEITPQSNFYEPKQLDDECPF